MKLCAPLLFAAGVHASCKASGPPTIGQLNGIRFLSPYAGQNVTNVTGVVVARGPDGLFIRSLAPDNDTRTSDAIYVYLGSSTNRTIATAGDAVSLDGRVSEYRSDDSYLYLTELSASGSAVRVQSHGHVVSPRVIGVDTGSPPTGEFTALDGGDVFAVPGGVANVSAVNPVLQPERYGLDFWESLSGELVTVRNATVLGRPNSHRDTWVVGDWKATGRNAHGGLTMSDKDANPEAILIGSPLDGTKNPTTAKMGDFVGDVTGVVTQAFGFYRILPLTALKSVANATAQPPKLTLAGTRTCSGLTVGDYNVENFAASSTAHVAAVATHIAVTMGAPDLIFVQEIQDNSGSKDDGVVSANGTLTALAAAISKAGNVTYSWVAIDPVDGQDGGEPGGNIRQAYLWRPEAVELYRGGGNGGAGGSTDANEVLPGPALKYNPGRIDPANAAWNASRKPLAAAWMAKGASRPFFTVNVHWSSKGGSSSLHGDARPPINGVVENRERQANVTAAFVAQILAKDANASVIVAGDFNEFTFVQPLKTFTAKSGLRDLDEVTGHAPAERYTYSYDMNAQELDHMYVSPSLEKGATFEHIHVNSWADAKGEVSDHDPSVALLNVC